MSPIRDDRRGRIAADRRAPARMGQRRIGDGAWSAVPERIALVRLDGDVRPGPRGPRRPRRPSPSRPRAGTGHPQGAAGCAFACGIRGVGADAGHSEDSAAPRPAAGACFRLDVGADDGDPPARRTAAPRGCDPSRAGASDSHACSAVRARGRPSAGAARCESKWSTGERLRLVRALSADVRDCLPDPTSAVRVLADCGPLHDGPPGRRSGLDSGRVARGMGRQQW